MKSPGKLVKNKMALHRKTTTVNIFTLKQITEKKIGQGKKFI